MSHAVVLVVLDGKVKKNKIEEEVGRQMAPFDENGGWFADGSRWDWWVIGGRWSDRLLSKKGKACDYLRKKDLDLDGMAQARVERLRAGYRECKEKYADNPKLAELVYGVEPGETEDEYAAGNDACPVPAHAVLRNFEWYENTRMGWFGGSAEPESGSDKGVSILNFPRKRGVAEAKIVTCNLDDDRWDTEFLPKLLAELDDNAWLVVVDYHV